MYNTKISKSIILAAIPQRLILRLNMNRIFLFRIKLSPQEKQIIRRPLGGPAARPAPAKPGHPASGGEAAGVLFAFPAGIKIPRL